MNERPRLPKNQRRKFITIFVLAAIGWALVMRGIFGVYEWVRSDKTPPPVAAQESIDTCLNLGEVYLPEGGRFTKPKPVQTRWADRFWAWTVTAEVERDAAEPGSVICTINRFGELTSMRFTGIDLSGDIPPLPIVPIRD
jgi:hypothetical protein